MLNEIIKFSKKPEVFSKSTNKFWDDEYISQQMLKAHLDKNFDAATRIESTVKKTVAFITGIVKKHNFKTLLDMGCGPGIYCEMFYENGIKVSGLDLSKRSIEYAIKQSQKNNSKIQYYNQNYLKIKINQKFDVITLIYCDYGVLPQEERITLLRNIHNLLNPGGLLIFDVFTPNQYDDFVESNSYYVSDGPGFWCENKHLCLDSSFAYENDIHLSQTIVIEDNKLNVYRIWDEAFTKEKITEELEKADFIVEKIYGDLTGVEYSVKSKTMGIIAIKK